MGTRVVEVTVDRPALLADATLVPDLRDASTVYWAASRINPLVAIEHPELVTQDSVDFEAFLAAATRQMPGATVVLLSSGGTVYGSSPPPHSEDTIPRPISAYGRAKLRLETMLQEASIRSVIARVSNAYGPGQSPAPGQGVIAHWLKALDDEEPVTVFGDLSTVRDYVFIEDVTDLLASAHLRPGVPGVLNVGSGMPTSLASVVDAIHSVVGNRRLEIDFEPKRPFDLTAAWLDVSLAASSMGWKATTSLDEGIRRMWAWLHTRTQ
jgi:UDP-glucose 4-epimerase